MEPTTKQKEEARDAVLSAGVLKSPKGKMEELFKYLADAAIGGKSVSRHKAARELFGADDKHALALLRSVKMRLIKNLTKFFKEDGKTASVLITFAGTKYSLVFESRDPGPSTDERFFGLSNEKVRWPENVRFWELLPPRNLMREPDVISLTPCQEKVRLAAPLGNREEDRKAKGQVEAFIGQLTKKYPEMTRERYWKFLEQEGFLPRNQEEDKGDDVPSRDSRLGRRMEIIRQLSGSRELMQAKLLNIENFLLTRTRQDAAATTVREWNDSHPRKKPHRAFQENSA